MRLIDADKLYKSIVELETLARDRVIDTPNSFPNGSLNPAAIRYMAQLSERTRFKEMVYDALTIEPKRETGKWILSDNQRREDTENGNYLYICSNCQYSDVHSKAVEVPYCWHCGADMREEKNDIKQL